MNNSSAVLLALLAALLLAGTALAQTDRANRRCTSATLSTDAAAPCPDDVVNDGTGVSVGGRAPASSTAGGVNTTSGIATPPIPGITGAASTGAVGTTGAGSTDASKGATGATGVTAPGAVNPGQTGKP